MASKITSFFILILSWVIYDTFGTNEWVTEFVVIYYSVFYGFILFWMSRVYLEAKLKIDRNILLMLHITVLLKLVMELSSIGLTRDEYDLRTQNSFIDLLTWLALGILLIIALWEKFIHSRRK